MKYDVDGKGKVRLIGVKKDVIDVYPVDVKDLLATGYKFQEGVLVAKPKRKKPESGKPILANSGSGLKEVDLEKPKVEDNVKVVIGSALKDE